MVATLKNGTRDGTLVLVSRTTPKQLATDIAHTLQNALDNWETKARNFKNVTMS